jgi:hypothetical protein
LRLAHRVRQPQPHRQNHRVLPERQLPEKTLPTEDRKRLESNGFVIVPTDLKDMYALYEDITTKDPEYKSAIGGPAGKRALFS